MGRQPVKLEEMAELENHLATATIITVSSKRRQWEPVGESWRKTERGHGLKASPRKLFLHDGGKSRNFTVENLGRHCLNQAIKVNITGHEAKNSVTLPMGVPEKGTTSPMHHLSHQEDISEKAKLRNPPITGHSLKKAMP